MSFVNKDFAKVRRRIIIPAIELRDLHQKPVSVFERKKLTDAYLDSKYVLIGYRPPQFRGEMADALVPSDVCDPVLGRDFYAYATFMDPESRVIMTYDLGDYIQRGICPDESDIAVPFRIPDQTLFARCDEIKNKKNDAFCDMFSEYYGQPLNGSAMQKIAHKLGILSLVWAPTRKEFDSLDALKQYVAGFNPYLKEIATLNPSDFEKGQLNW